MSGMTKKQAEFTIEKLMIIGTEFAQFAGMNLQPDWMPADFSEPGQELVDWFMNKLETAREKSICKLSDRVYKHGVAVNDSAVIEIKRTVRYLAMKCRSAGMDVPDEIFEMVGR